MRAAECAVRGYGGTPQKREASPAIAGASAAPAALAEPGEMGGEKRDDAVEWSDDAGLGHGSELGDALPPSPCERRPDPAPAAEA